MAAGWAVVAMFATGQLWYGLPGPGSWDRLAELATECVTVMQRYAAPIHSSEGVQFLFVASIALLAILVDFLAITEDMPGVAGPPLLAAFLTAAATAAHPSRRGTSSSPRPCGSCSSRARVGPGATLVDHGREHADPWCRTTSRPR